MKRQPNFEYYWEGCNKAAIVVNLRPHKGIRHMSTGNVHASSLDGSFWRKAKSPLMFKITRKQFRQFKRTGEHPHEPKSTSL
jgi:hypothetical protein